MSTRIPGHGDGDGRVELRGKSLARCFVVGVAALLSANCSESEPPPRGESAFVAGYERAIADPKTQAFAGEILLAELNCVACHGVAPAIAERLRSKRAPSLVDVSARLAPETIAAFVADPGHFKPGTTMPNLFAGRVDAELAVEKIVGFLAPVGHRAFRGRHNATVERGRVLYETLGCAACHGVDPSTRAEGDVPLRLGMHYDFAALTAFLKDPLAIRASGRMPHLGLSDGDARDLAEYLTTQRENTGSVESAPKARAESTIAGGRAEFVRSGCASCHATVLRSSRTPTPAARPLSELDPQAASGCLAPRPVAPAADYRLDPRQRIALGEAIERLRSPSLQPLDAAARVARTLLVFNCLACHERAGLGGPGGSRDDLFTGDEDLGDEGRLPPPLTGVGAKFKKPWLTKVLAGAGGVRPYLRTRMPGFGDDNLGSLAEDLSTADDRRFGTRRGALNFEQASEEIIEAGRRLLGSKGLQCITCHDLGANRSIGIRGLNLRGITDRIRPDWFEHKLLNPGALRKTTLMPSLWPDGRSTHVDILGGDAHAQIHAIWSYLREPTKAPAGYPPPRGVFELRPTAETVLLRCFMKDAGTHAIAVGSPRAVHFAFDADAVKPAIAWRGKFLDSYSTWFSRFQPAVEPLGEDVVRLPEARLSRDDASKPASRVMGGYRLDEAGVPTFLYRVGSVEVTDRITPADEGRGLSRTLRLEGVSSGMRFDPGSAPGVTIRVTRPERPDAAAFTIPVDARGRTAIEVVYSW